MAAGSVSDKVRQSNVSDAYRKSPVAEPGGDLRPPTPKPDMGAVYILLGCLTVSGVVVLGILIYCCTAHCWRRHCFKARRSVPTIKISSSVDDGYVALKRNRMNGRAKSAATATSTDEQSSTTSPPSGKQSWTDSLRLTKSESLARCEQLQQQKNKMRRYEKRGGGVGGIGGFGVGGGCGGGGGGGGARREQCQNLLSNGGDVSPPDSSVANGRLTLAGCDALADEAERRSVLHYDIGYEKNRTECCRGSLTFALRYDYIHRVLMVHAIRANRLTAKDGSPCFMDPYVKLYLLPERRYHCKTKIYRRTADPEFNEMFSFDAPYTSLSSRMLQFTVYDFDRFTRHGLVGNVIMRDLFEKSDLYTWTEYTMHIVGNNEKDDYGDLLLYLNYDANDAKLMISVAKAYNLRPMDITGASDPYVKIIQLQGRKRVKTRRTTMKRANLHPVYNELLTFDLPESQIEGTNVLIKVMDWDRIGSDDLLGCCVLGNDSPTLEGRRQWQQCLSKSSRESVGMWHSLLADIPDDFANISK